MLNIVGHRKIWFSFSGALVAISILLIAFLEPNLGIDFTGGTSMEYRFSDRPSSIEVEEVIEMVANGGFEFKEIQAVAKEDAESPQEKFIAPESFVIGKLHIQPVGSHGLVIKVRALENNQIKAISLALKQRFGDNTDETRIETIGPVVGHNLRKKALMAMVLAIFFIIVYIAFAFRKIPKSLSPVRFGVTAVIALIHDVLLTMGVFMMLGYFLGVEIDSLFITALLTIMGFSVHDTIVVFDRIRENLIRSKQQGFAEIANDSVNQTLSRSINTSLTTLITLAALFLFGGGSIKWFVFAMIIGIFVGTYSSIFLATPILVVWRQVLLKRGRKV